MCPTTPMSDLDGRANGDLPDPLRDDTALLQAERRSADDISANQYVRGVSSCSKRTSRKIVDIWQALASTRKLEPLSAGSP
jgi:hypothetical protein